MDREVVAYYHLCRSRKEMMAREIMIFDLPTSVGYLVYSGAPCVEILEP